MKALVSMKFCVVIICCLSFEFRMCFYLSLPIYLLILWICCTCSLVVKGNEAKLTNEFILQNKAFLGLYLKLAAILKIVQNFGFIFKGRMFLKYERKYFFKLEGGKWFWQITTLLYCLTSQQIISNLWKNKT